MYFISMNVIKYHIPINFCSFCSWNDCQLDLFSFILTFEKLDWWSQLLKHRGRGAGRRRGCCAVRIVAVICQEWQVSAAVRQCLAVAEKWAEASCEGKSCQTKLSNQLSRRCMGKQAQVLWKAANIQLIILGGAEHKISSPFYGKASQA